MDEKTIEADEIRRLGSMATTEHLTRGALLAVARDLVGGAADAGGVEHWWLTDAERAIRALREMLVADDARWLGACVAERHKLTDDDGAFRCPTGREEAARLAVAWALNDISGDQPTDWPGFAEAALEAVMDGPVGAPSFDVEIAESWTRFMRSAPQVAASPAAADVAEMRARADHYEGLVAEWQEERDALARALLALAARSGGELVIAAPDHARVPEAAVLEIHHAPDGVTFVRVGGAT